jgi:hypothetical protein
MALALLLLFGIVPLSVGYLILREWTAERTALVVCGALFLISGATMLLSALWLLVGLGRQRLPLWTGGTATILSAIVLLGATFTDVLPCPGPT